MSNKETLAEFIARGGKVVKVPAKKSKGYVAPKMKLAGHKPETKALKDNAYGKMARRAL